MLVMDLHAHLCTNEVIGTGGSFERRRGAMRGGSQLSVADWRQGRTMDPVAEVELKAQVEAENMKVVGWYHSHAVFERGRAA